MSTATGHRRPAVDFGYRTRTVRVHRFSARIPLRATAVAAALFLIAAAAAAVAIGFGDYRLSAAEVTAALAGTGEPFHRTIVVEWRLPVALAAVVFGALLGLGGGIFQSLTRNPLGSPDVIGFDAGSHTAVVLTVLVLGSGNHWTVAAASLTGGLATAAAVYALAYRRGLQGFRLIVVGIGVSAALGSANAYLITRADITDAMAVGFWSAGSIGRVDWDGMGPSLAAAALIAAAAVFTAPLLHRLATGDDTALVQGVRPGPARLALLVVGVAATALVTAAAGPIGFVALVAPQLANRLAPRPGASLLPAAAMGAALLSAAHLLSLLIAQAYRPVPVGLITVCLGGIYLIWLLIRETRRRAATA